MSVEHRFRVMNTDALLVLVNDDHAAAGAALRRAETRAREIEATFSRFMPNSELSRLNGTGGAWTRVSRDMSDVLALASALHHDTRGLFDPAILSDLEHAGYDRTFEALPADRASSGAPRREHPTFAEVVLDGDAVRLPKGVRLDLGGIVKGWAADDLADRLAELGPCLVELGGDTAVRGAPDGADGWEIGVRVSSRDTLLGVVRITNSAVATSGTDARRWRVDGQWAHHLIDPRTGEPSRTALVQVTAFAERAASAEVWAKAALIGGEAAAAEMLAQRYGLELILVLHDGLPVASRGVPLVYGPPVNA